MSDYASAESECEICREPTNDWRICPLCEKLVCNDCMEVVPLDSSDINKCAECKEEEG